MPALLGCGTVIFPTDDCLASERRKFRRQRRHVRATRLRIARLRRLLAHVGVLTTAQLESNGCAWPWLLAARVLREPNTLTAEEQTAGWKLLFDGRSLGGWHLYQQKGEPKTGWHVEQGVLICPKTNGRPNGSGGDLVTDTKFVDFEFSFEWRISPAGNSGVLYLFDESRAPGGPPMYRGDTGHSPLGFEYQVLDNENHPDGKRGPTHRAGALYDLNANDKAAPKPVGEWNESRIVLRGKHIEHWLNGVKSAEADLDSAAYREAFAKSKYHVVPKGGAPRICFGRRLESRRSCARHGPELIR
ncbi:uncharacterized protein DUF1080 [Chthoniobacter flavus]|nr:DUF1080 domain-containing protein [Chthoniobacter flavus]TCO87702.1 uncharacterized protein DUF1080 [Chthoniobacter flavus]